MLTEYPDASRYTPNVDLTPYPGVCARAGMSDGTDTSAPLDMRDPYFPIYRERARAAGKLFSGYHWINHGKGAACARSYFSIAGTTPAMIDGEDEPGNSGYNGPLTVQDFLDFAGTLRAMGGVVWGAYLPHWYWYDHMGQATLTPLADAGLALVSSNYSGSGGWAPYGGVTPSVWQFASTPHDRNWFQGDAAGLAKLWQIGTAPVPPTPTPVPPASNWTEQIVQNLPTLAQGARGGAVSIMQGMLIGHGYGLNPDGDFGPVTNSVVRSFQGSRGLVQDGIVGQHTYTALLTA